MDESTKIVSRQRRPRIHANASVAGGKGMNSSYSTWDKSTLARTGDYVLDPGTLRKLYKRTSSVRWCVDTIARTTADLPWAIVPNYEGKIRNSTIEHIIEITSFLNNPNVNPESFNDLVQYCLKDVLVVAQGVIEKVFNIGRNLSELWARDAATFHPVKDDHGVLQGYIQQLSVAKQTKTPFSNAEIIYVSLDGVTNEKYPVPIIESIVNEVGALLFSVDWIADSFTEDEIPPGVLVLGDIGNEAYLRAKEDFQEKKGIHGKGNIRVIDNAKDVNWIEFKKTNTEMQLVSLIERFDRIVYRNYGIEFEVIGSDITGLTLTEKLQKFHLIKPLAKRIAWKMNNEVIPSFGYRDVNFQYVIRDLDAEKERAQASKTMLITGQRSINEIRLQDGRHPINGGDRKFMLIGKRIVFVDDLDAMESEVSSKSEDNQREGTTESAQQQEQKETDVASDKDEETEQEK